MAKEYARRFPTDTSMEVYTPKNPQPVSPETDPVSVHLTQVLGSEQTILGSTPKLDVLKSKTILGTDSTGKIIEGTHQDISGKENVGVAAGLDANHLSAYDHTKINNQTSIKKTRYFGRTWTTGDSVFIKTKMAFLADENFVRVFEDEVLLDYGTDWTFNTTNGKKLGVVSDLTDGVEILSPVNSSVYRVEFDEYLIPLCPMIGLKRSDGKMHHKGLPRNTVCDDSRSGIISNSSYDDGTKIYTITYKKPDTSTFTLTKQYADRAFCCDFDFNKALPTGWRIEVYKVGRHWSGNRASGPGDDYETMNSILSPRFTVDTNIFSLDFLFDKKRSGQVKIKLRNTTTNEVSLFSSQTICSRQFKYMDRTWTPLGVRYHKITLK